MNISKRACGALIAAVIGSAAGCKSTPQATASPPSDLGRSSHLLAPNRAEWKLSFNDEFNGTALDESKWSIGLPWKGTDGSNRHHNNQYASYIMDDDLSVSEGALHLTTQRRDVTGKNGRVFHYTQGLITTRNKFEQKYGYFEARLRFPLAAGPGLWPAFWTLSDGWPPEMDICEVWTSTMRRHQGTALRGADGRVNWTSWNSYGPIDPGYSVWAIEWGPGYQVYTLDGVVTARLHGTQVTDDIHYVLLNSGVESGNPPTEQTVFPNSFDVDYVRVYARPDEPVILNGSFNAKDEWPWSRYGRTAVVSYESKSPPYCARVDGGHSAFEQTVYGLLPNTSYRVSASAKQGSKDADVRLGAKDFGGEEASVSAPGDGWETITLRFTTGPSATSARIYCHVPPAGGVGYFDDLTISRVNE